MISILIALFFQKTNKPKTIRKINHTLHESQKKDNHKNLIISHLKQNNQVIQT